MGTRNIRKRNSKNLSSCSIGKLVGLPDSKSPEIDIDFEVGTADYIFALADEIIDAWKMEKYRYVFSSLRNSPPALTAAVMDGFEFEVDRQKFLAQIMISAVNDWKP